jgi:hypothetical protein
MGYPCMQCKSVGVERAATVVISGRCPNGHEDCTPWETYACDDHCDEVVTMMSTSWIVTQTAISG